MTVEIWVVSVVGGNWITLLVRFSWFLSSLCDITVEFTVIQNNGCTSSCIIQSTDLNSRFWFSASRGIKTASCYRVVVSNETVFLHVTRHWLPPRLSRLKRTRTLSGLLCVSRSDSWTARRAALTAAGTFNVSAHGQCANTNRGSQLSAHSRSVSFLFRFTNSLTWVSSCVYFCADWRWWALAIYTFRRPFVLRLRKAQFYLINTNS